MNNEHQFKSEFIEHKKIFKKMQNYKNKEEKRNY